MRGVSAIRQWLARRGAAEAPAADPEAAAPRPVWPRGTWPWLALAGAAGLVLAGGNALPFSGRSHIAAPIGSGDMAPVQAEAYGWRPVAIGGGGYITGLSSDAKGVTRVARADVYGAYIWDSATDRWRQLVHAAAMPASMQVQSGAAEGVYEIVVAPGDPRRLYMALKGRVFRSDDGGGHWDTPETPPFPLQFDPNSAYRLYGPFLTVDPANSDLVLFGSPANGLFRSTDGARSWQRVESVPVSADLVEGPDIQAPGTLSWFAPDAPARIYAASAGHGVFVSEDRGARFAPLGPASAPGPRTVTQGAFGKDGAFYAVEQVAKKLWVFRSGKWTDLTSDGRLTAADYAAVAVRPGDGAIFATDMAGQAWCSADAGASWRRLIRTSAVGQNEPPWLPQLGPLGYFSGGQVRFDPVRADRLWLAGGSGPYVADVGSGCPIRLAWTSQVRGIEELVANDVVAPPGQYPVFAVWDFGTHVKPDLDSYSTSWGPKRRELISAQQIDWSASDPAFLVTNASDARTFCCSEDGDSVLAGYSQDGGRSWRKFESLPTPPGTKAEDPWRMAFGSIAVAADDTSNIVWEPALQRSPYYTLDRGKSWQRVVLPGEVLPLTGSYPDFWGGRKTLAADRVQPGTFYLVHTGGGANARLAGLWRSRDRGMHWQRVFSGPIAPFSERHARLRAVPGKAGHLFFTAAIRGGPDTRLRRSIDGGRSWRAIEQVKDVDDIGFGKAAQGSNYPAIYISGKISGRYGIWRSVDNAASWQRLAEFPLGRIDQVSAVEGDKDVFGRVYLGYSGSGFLYGQPAGSAGR